MDLTKITGIGPAKAKELIKNNVTLEDLLDPDKYKEHSKLLTHHQKIGVLYYHDLQKKIPQEIIKKFKHILIHLILNLLFVVHLEEINLLLEILIF